MPPWANGQSKEKRFYPEGSQKFAFRASIFFLQMMQSNKQFSLSLLSPFVWKQGKRISPFCPHFFALPPALTWKFHLLQSSIMERYLVYVSPKWIRGASFISLCLNIFPLFSDFFSFLNFLLQGFLSLIRTLFLALSFYFICFVQKLCFLAMNLKLFLWVL